MFNQLTYKKKNQLLLLSMLPIAYLVYTFALKKTIETYSSYTENKDKMNLAVNAPTMAAELENQLLQITSKLGNNHINGQNTEQALIEFITNYCQLNHIVLREFPETVVSKEGDLLIETNQFTVEGNFEALIKLVYQLEQKNKLGKTASVHYQLKKDFETKEMALIATIYLQNIKQQQHEK